MVFNLRQLTKLIADGLTNLQEMFAETDPVAVLQRSRSPTKYLPPATSTQITDTEALSLGKRFYRPIVEL